MSSSPVFDQYPPTWMQSHHSQHFFEGQPQNHNANGQISRQYSSASETPYNYDQNFAFQPQYQPYEDVSSGYTVHPVTQSTHSPQRDLHSHRRQNSTSTTASYNSFRSPYPHALQGHYPPTAYDNPYADQTYEAYSGGVNSGAHYQKHLPTPAHTPVQDSHMDGQRGYDRRSGGAVAGQRGQRSGYNDEGVNIPRIMNGDQSGEDYGSTQASRRVPAFDRTYSAVVQDELFDPNAVTRQAHPGPPHNNGIKQPAMLGPYTSIVNDRLQAANDARVAHAPAGRLPRDVSPFRQNSPFAGSGSGPTYAPINSAAIQRQKQKAETDALIYERHHQPPDDSQPTTISPKDAVLDYHQDPDDGPAGLPLFPQSSATSDGSNYDTGSRNYAPLANSRQQMPSQYQLPTANFNFTTPSVPASANPSATSGDYKFPPQHYRAEQSEDSQEQQDYPAHLISMDTSKSEQEGESHDSDIERPTGTTADGGTYSCTYHGCSQRFNSPALLQKHKREGHRSSVSISSPSAPAPASPSGSADARNSQAGPHRCDRINPSTGKACNTVFSRPYDLTRHEDTIHGQRTKVRCAYCTEEKTFSRSDALTRHMRVVHPQIDFPGKHRRRGEA